MAKVIKDPKDLVKYGLITDRSIASSIMAGQKTLASALKYVTVSLANYIIDETPDAPVEEPIVEAPAAEEVVIDETPVTPIEEPVAEEPVDEVVDDTKTAKKSKKSK